MDLAAIIKQYWDAFIIKYGNTVQNGRATFRYTESKTGKICYRALKGEDCLYLIFRHVLSKGFRRIRDFGFLHGNPKNLLQLIQLVLHVKHNTAPSAKGLFSVAHTATLPWLFWDFATCPGILDKNFEPAGAAAHCKQEDSDFMKKFALLKPVSRLMSSCALKNQYVPAAPALPVS